MSIDTRQNRPNGESSHAPEERNYSEHGRRKPGDSRFASGSGQGYPYNSPYYAPPEEGDDEGAFVDSDGSIFTDSEIAEALNPEGVETGADG